MSSGYCVANKLKSHGYALLPMLLSMLLPAVTALFALPASAATITSFSPTGEVAQVRQARAAFSEAAIKFGDPRAAAPFDVSCSVPGQSRWADDRHWIYDFAQDVPPGTNCSFTLKTGYKLLSGAAVTGVASFKFGTGGPAVLRTMPSGGEIDEEQMFVLFQNVAVDRATLLQHVFCEAEGVHEQIPVRLVEKEPRAQFAAESLILLRQRCLVGTCAKGNFIFAGKGVGSETMPHPRKFKPVEQQSHLGGRTRLDLHTRLCGGRHQRKDTVQSRLAAFDGCLCRKRVHQPRLEVAGIAKVQREKLFAALVQRKKLKLGSRMVKPGHSLRGGATRAGGDNDLEPAKMPAAIPMLATVVQPQNSQGQNAVDNSRGLRLADADHRIG